VGFEVFAISRERKIGEGSFGFAESSKEREESSNESESEK
jgi:hypothetical protein